MSKILVINQSERYEGKNYFDFIFLEKEIIKAASVSENETGAALTI